MGTSGYGSTGIVLASTLTDSNGNFSFAPGAYSCPQSNTQVYLMGIGGNAGAGNNGSAVEAAALGDCATAKNGFVVMNEVTTAAAAFVLSHFFSTTLGGANGANDWFGGPSTTSGGTTVYSQGLVMGDDVTIPTIISNASGAPNQNHTGFVVESAKMQHDCEHPVGVYQLVGLHELHGDQDALRQAVQLDGERRGDAALRHAASSRADGAISSGAGG